MNKSELRQKLRLSKLEAMEYYRLYRQWKDAFKVLACAVASLIGAACAVAIFYFVSK